ncbi:Tat proofreading chaperone FdhE [Hydrogenivirga caldilitoris]|uniref:Tat proofreading chaperone FdhE n=1 Tax=Hydrogenivirga caldilitoris TaxID=246264 RepID=A0A497XQ52_9AQUI|nr:formate dehydrogenase accessory protein FdhE [Hydrogenivirga caldilitoris]RLJ71107.1 Tat proofreading chaperone FdhE [Hydrogenivirga caldilitoris]
MNIFKQKEREFALARVKQLKEKFPESRQILDFMERILEFQNRVIEDISEKGIPIDTSEAQGRIKHGKPALNLSSVDWKPFLPYMRELLDIASDIGTEEIKAEADRLRLSSQEELLAQLVNFTEGMETNPIERLLFMAFLQPILYVVSDSVSFKQEAWLKNTCPVCGSKPSVSFLTDTEEWEGGRLLRCSLCLTDWLYIRTKCVECGNNEDDKLDYFVSQDVSYIELQACTQCHRYIKLVDMRKDGLAVPDLEDIASVSLDLWAEGEGYTKVEKNLLGF